MRGQLIHNAIIQTQTEYKSETGIVRQIWSNKALDVICRIEPASREMIDAYGRLGIRITHQIFLDTEQSLTIKDRFVFNGEGLEVRNVVPVYARATTPYHWEVIAERNPL